MPRYDLVVNAIDSLANRVHGLSQDKRAHETQMRNLGLANARMNMEAQTLAGRRELEMAKLKREQYLDEPISFGQAIQTSKFPDQNKAALLKQFEPILNLPTTRRKAGEGLFNYMQRQDVKGEAKEGRKFAAEQNRLKMASNERIANKKVTTKPTNVMNQMKLQAWQDYMQGKATPQQQDMIGINKDPYLTQAAQIVAQDYDTLEKGPEAIVAKVGAIADQLRANRQQNPKEPKENAVRLRGVYDPKTNTLVFK